MLKRSSTDERESNRLKRGRVRVNLHPDLTDRIERRLEQERMSLSAYLQHLIRVDTGAYTGTLTD